MNLTLTCPVIKIGVTGINSSKAPRNSDQTTKRGHNRPPIGNVCAAPPRPAHTAHAFFVAALILWAELGQQGGSWGPATPLSMWVDPGNCLGYRKWEEVQLPGRAGQG